MAKSKTVQRSVSVTNPDTGQSEWFHKGDTLPAWATELVTNEKVFIDPDNPDGPTEADDPDFYNLPENREERYNGLTVDELRALADDRGLDSSGKKADLIQRLSESDAAQS